MDEAVCVAFDVTVGNAGLAPPPDAVSLDLAATWSIYEDVHQGDEGPKRPLTFR